MKIQHLLRSEYKHHSIFKFLVSASQTGSITWVSDCYGGRASDVYIIVRDSGFRDILEPYEQVMAGRGFKIRSDLEMKQCRLAIPPSNEQDA